MMASLQALATRVAGLSGWRRNVAAYLFGALSTLTLAPFFCFPLLVPSFSGLYWLMDSAPSRRRLFLDGWWWGWGFHMTGLYWFCIALLTDVDKFAWLIPFALFGLTGVIALFAGVACWLMSWLRVQGVMKIALFSVVWTGVECARGHLFTGFPWNLAGYSFGFSDASLQMASLVGAYGLTWFAVLLGCSAAALTYGKNGMRLAVLLWALFFVGFGWGGWRLHMADQVPEQERYVEGVMLRLVQANIQQPNKWEPGLQMKGLQEYVRLTQSDGIDHITHVIWPETAVPYAIKAGTALPHRLGDILPEDTVLITGTLRVEGDEENWQIWNSLMAIDHAGGIVGAYDKIHLVPFGEFLPFRSLLPKEWLTPVGDKDFSTGKHPHAVSWAGLPPMIPLICYEAIFPEMAEGDSQPPAAQWLLTVTNDAWFGMSIGPYQHFHMARMRAVEQGIPLVRVANTGISAVVDSYGRVLSSLPLGTQGILDVRLPVAQPNPTMCHKDGFFICLLVFITIALLLFRRPYN